MSLAWPLHKAGIREDAVRAESVLIVPGERERFELWVDGQKSRPFIKAIYVGEGDGYNWTETNELYIRLSDLSEDLRKQVHAELSAKLIPDFDAKQKEKYGL